MPRAVPPVAPSGNSLGSAAKAEEAELEEAALLLEEEEEEEGGEEEDEEVVVVGNSGTGVAEVEGIAVPSDCLPSTSSKSIPMDTLD